MMSGVNPALNEEMTRVEIASNEDDGVDAVWQDGGVVQVKRNYRSKNDS